MADNCCHGCDKREVGCHASCADYLAWKARNDARREEARKERLKYIGLNESDFFREGWQWRQKKKTVGKGRRK